ncbi:MAG: hypothetical protein GX758_02470 [Tenericutes bacterium]|nr:hypothetical protein [Mycoplasmatota bacterium]
MMKSDMLKLSILYNLRRKNSNIYFIILLICCILCSLVLIFSNNVTKIIDRSITKNIGFRTVSIINNTTETEVDIINKIISIDNVIDVYPGDYQEINLKIVSISNENFDGFITLKRATKNTWPQFVKSIEQINDKSGVIVCPEKFYPYEDILKIDKNKQINLEDLFNKTLKVKYYDFKYDNNKRPTENNEYFKEFRIMGSYDSTELFNDNRTCYITDTDLNEIVDKILELWKENVNYDNASVVVSTGYNVVIDSTNNVNLVIQKLSDLGFEVIGLNSSLDVKLIKTLNISIVVVLFLVIFGVLFISLSHIKKRMISEEINIGVAKSSGYNCSDLCYIYSFETFFYNLFIYLIGLIITILIIYLLKKYNSFFISIELLIGGFAINGICFIVSFLIIILIPIIITIYNVILIYKSSTKNILSNGG